MNIRAQLKVLITIALVTLLTMIASSLYGLNRLGDLLNNVNTEAVFYQTSVNTSRQAQVEFQRQIQEWKDILIRGNDQELYDKYYGNFEAKEKAMDSNLLKLKEALAKHGDVVKPVDDLIEVHKALGEKYRAALTEGWKQDDQMAGKNVDLLVRGIDRATSKGMDVLATDLQKVAEESMSKIKKQAEASTRLILSIVIGVGVVSLLLFLVIARRIGQNILTLLGAEPKDLVGVFRALAGGDFTVNVPLRVGDRTSMTAQIALMQRKMRNMVMAVKNGTGELQALATVMNATDTPMSPKKFAEATQKAVTGLNEAVARFQVEKDA